MATARDLRESRGKAAYEGTGDRQYLPKVVQEALSIYGMIDGDTFQNIDEAYTSLKDIKGLSSVNTYKGLLSRYFKNKADAGGLSNEEYESYLEGTGIPTASQINSETSGTDRFVQGIGKMYGQAMYGIGSMAGTSDNIQAERKQYVRGVKDKEDLWKSYNAEVDFGGEGEMDMPWNIAGGTGEAFNARVSSCSTDDPVWVLESQFQFCPVATSSVLSKPFSWSKVLSVWSETSLSELISSSAWRSYLLLPSPHV